MSDTKQQKEYTVDLCICGKSYVKTVPADSEDDALEKVEQLAQDEGRYWNGELCSVSEFTGELSDKVLQEDGTPDPVTFIEVKFHDNDFGIAFRQALAFLYMRLLESRHSQEHMNVLSETFPERTNDVTRDVSKILRQLNEDLILKDMIIDFAATHLILKNVSDGLYGVSELNRELSWERPDGASLDKYISYFEDIKIVLHTDDELRTSADEGEFLNGENFWIDLRSGKTGSL